MNTDQLSESRAVGEATAIIQQIGDLSIQPSGKRFMRSRPAAAELWGRLESLADQRCEAACSTKPAKRAPKPRAVDPAANISPGNT